MIDTLIHELAHHKEFVETGEAEDLTPSHSTSMTYVAAAVVQNTARGDYHLWLKDVTW